MNMNHNKKAEAIIASSLGIEPLPVANTAPKEVAVFNPSDIQLDSALPHAKTDYEFSRNNIKHLLEKGNEALTEALEVAAIEGKSRGYEVVSGLIKNLADVTQAYFDLQEKTKKLMSKSDEPLGGMSIKSENTQVYMATPQEFAERMKARKDAIETDKV